MEQEILNYLRGQETEIFRDLRLLVEAQASTDEISALRACRETIEKLVLLRTGIICEVLKRPGGHDLLRFAYGEGEESILLSGHYDTVHAAGSLPYREESERIFGPGICDMKSGVISAIWTIRALQALGISPGKRILVLLNGDEETGSGESSEQICREALGAKAALVLEPSTENGDLKSGRKGMLTLRVTITGREAHSGNAHAYGANAIEEMAREILFAQSLTDYEAGVTVNVGLAHGGSRINVVPGHAEFLMEARAWKSDRLDRIAKAIREVETQVPGTARQVQLLAQHRPMEQSAGTLALFETAKKCGERLGLSFSHQAVGGFGDANSIAAMNVPVLDGLGAVGGGAHSPEEFIWKDRFLPRIALAASLVLRL